MTNKFSQDLFKLNPQNLNDPFNKEISDEIDEDLDLNPNDLNLENEERAKEFILNDPIDFPKSKSKSHCKECLTKLIAPPEINRKRNDRCRSCFDNDINTFSDDYNQPPNQSNTIPVSQQLNPNQEQICTFCGALTDEKYNYPVPITLYPNQKTNDFICSECLDDPSINYSKSNNICAGDACRRKNFKQNSTFVIFNDQIPNNRITPNDALFCNHCANRLNIIK